MGTAARILVADDKPADVQALVGPLEEAGYEVLTVDNGFTVAHVAAERQPDLIMLAAAAILVYRHRFQPRQAEPKETGGETA